MTFVAVYICIYVRIVSAVRVVVSLCMLAAQHGGKDTMPVVLDIFVLFEDKAVKPCR
jgi:hypothetical protein